MIKIIHAENLILFKKCVQKKGGTLNIANSYIDKNGDMFLVMFYEGGFDEREYNKRRIFK